MRTEWIGMIIVAACTAIVVPDAIAQTGFTFQGRVRDGGVLLDRECDMDIRLYDVESGGTALEEINFFGSNTVNIQNGLFSVYLDFDPAFFDGRPLWLEVEIECPPGDPIVLAPRQPLDSAPYAMHAFSGGEWTSTGGGLVFEGGNVGIGTSTPESELHVFESAGASVIVESVFSAELTLSSGNAQTSRISFKEQETDTTIFTIQANVNGTFSIIAPNGESFSMTQGGLVGIGADALQKLHVDGNVLADNVTVPSDARFKRDFEPIQRALTSLQHLTGTYYGWRVDEFPARQFSTDRQVGILAQDVHDVLPEAVIRNADGYLTVAYDRLIPLLIEGVKELNTIVESKDDELAELRTQLENTNERLAALERLIAQQTMGATNE